MASCRVMWPVKLRCAHTCWACVSMCTCRFLSKIHRQADFSCHRWKRAGHHLKSMSASWCMWVFCSSLGQRITTAALWSCACVQACVWSCLGACDCSAVPLPTTVSRLILDKTLLRQQQTHRTCVFNLHDRNEVKFQNKMYCNTRSVENDQSNCASIKYILDFFDRLNDKSI